MTTFGQDSWTSDSNTSGSGSKGNLFLKLKDGANKLRIVTPPYQYLVHKYKKEGDQGFGTKINCSMLNGSCPLCELAEACDDDKRKNEIKAKKRWYMGVIDRSPGSPSAGEFKILDISYAVYSGIKTLGVDPEWGDPTNYDINLTVNRKALPQDYYKVIGSPNRSPLTAEEQKSRDEADLEYIKKKITPPTPELVQKLMDKADGQDGKNDGSSAPEPTQQKSVKKPAAAPAKSKAPKFDDEEAEEDFPSYGK